MSTTEGLFRVGTSGYQYDHWKGRFYPAERSKIDWFAHYAEQFDTVEINNTFYRLPGAKTFERWQAQAPLGFTYALKYSRYGTHMKRLRDPQRHIDVYMQQASRLGRALGPILVQLPPTFRADPQRLADFLDAAPSSCRWAVEVRERSWFDERVYAVLRAHNAALCHHDMLQHHPRERTADWVYMRFHGPRGDYSGSYSRQALAGVARRITTYLDGGSDVYAYFNNDAQAYAVSNALALRRYVLGT